MSLGPYWKDPAAKLAIAVDWSLDFPGAAVAAIAWSSSDPGLVVTPTGAQTVLAPTADISGGTDTPASFTLGEDPALPVVNVREYFVECLITLADGHIDRRKLAVWVAVL